MQVICGSSSLFMVIYKKQTFIKSTKIVATATGLNAAFNKGLSNIKPPLNLSHHFKSCLSIQNLS